MPMVQSAQLSVTKLKGRMMKRLTVSFLVSLFALPAFSAEHCQVKTAPSGALYWEESSGKCSIAEKIDSLETEMVSWQMRMKSGEVSAAQGVSRVKDLYVKRRELELALHSSK